MANDPLKRMEEQLHIKGAGGTQGGTGRFFIGLFMLIIGGYLFFNSIRVSNGFGMGSVLYSYGSFRLTGGMVLFPFIFGIGMMFYNSKNVFGWILALGSIGMLGFGVIANINFRIVNMSAFELMTILVLFIGGLGLFLSSLKESK